MIVMVGPGNEWVLTLFLGRFYLHFRRNLKEDDVRVAQGELKDLTLNRGAVTNTHQLHLLGESGANTGDHVAYQGAVQTVLGTVFLLVVLAGYHHLTIFKGNVYISGNIL